MAVFKTSKDLTEASSLETPTGHKAASNALNWGEAWEGRAPSRKEQTRDLTLMVGLRRQPQSPVQNLTLGC